jgi:hypothetical protein
MTQQKDKYVFYISENGKLDRKNFKNLNGEFDGFDKESITNEYEILYDFNTNYLKCKNKFIDEFIQNTQINAQNKKQLLEWIPYDKFENIEYFDKGGFSNIYKAIWTDGFITFYEFEKKKWIRYGSIDIILKSFNNSSNLNEKFLNEV